MAIISSSNIDNEYPFVSVLMPVRNEGTLMMRSLKAALAQDYPAGRMEILVVDGMSTDGTRDIVSSFQASHPYLRLVDNPGRIVPTGLNAGLAECSGEIIIRVDGHCEIAPDYVRRCVEHLQTDGVDAVGGPLETVGQSRTAEAIALAMSSTFGVGGSAFRTVKGKSMLTDTVAFPAYRRSILDKAGLFDEELVRNQDDEYNYRLRKRGAKILLASDVHCCYYSRSTLFLLAKQYFQYGFWKVRVLQKHPRQMQPRQFAPFLFVSTILGLLAISPLVHFASKILLVELALYVVVNLSASVMSVKRGSWRLLSLIPATFAVLHLSYGLGFCAGCIKFWNRWGDRTSKFDSPTPSHHDVDGEMASVER
jgi:glycosyltransferase involved in cell wall biosynthesis